MPGASCFAMALPTLTTLLLWYVAGVALVVLQHQHPVLAALALVCIGAGWMVASRSPVRPRVALPFAAGFAAAGALLGWLALGARTHDCRYSLRDGHVVTATGAVQDANAQSAWLALQAIGDRPCSGTIRLLAGRTTTKRALQPGQVIRVRGEWWSDLNAGPLDVVNGMLVVHDWQSTGRRMWMAEWRGRAAARIAALFGDQAPLAAALLIAQRGQIDPKVKQDFAASGLAHLLAISGTHVALVAGVLALLTSILRVPTGPGSLCAALGGCAYVIFLGAPYPAVRAAVQIVLVLIARAAQRPAHPLALIAAAALAILVYDPLALLDAGFQLSFAGLVGIVLWRRPLIECQPHSLPRVLRDAIATSTAACLATTPIAAYHFGQISFIAVPANLVALPLVSLAVPAAAFALALSALSLPTATFLADGTRLLLVRLQETAAFAAAVPGGHVFITRTMVIASLAALVLGIMVWRMLWFMRRPVRLACALGLTCALPLAAPLLPTSTPDSIEIHAIDVGQGDALAIRSPLGRWLLVDAGPRSDRYDAGAARVVPFLLRHGARALEVLVLTHPHLDHVGGAAAVTAVLQTRLVLDPDSGRGARAALGENAFRQVRQWLPARPGTQLVIDGMTIEILYPDVHALDAATDPNDYSVIFRLGFGRFAALFTGDAPARVEEELMLRYGARLDVDLLKIGHHGSATATGDAWLRGSTPRIALISAGRGNRYGHPSAAVLQRLQQNGAQIFRTDRSGTVSLRAFRDGRIQVLDP